MDPDTIDQIDKLTAAVLATGGAVSLGIGFAKRFGGARFVLMRRLVGAIGRLVTALHSRLS